MMPQDWIRKGYLKHKKIIHKRHKTIPFLICVLTFIFLVNGCSGINPKFQDEYTKAGLSQDMREIFDEYRESIPKMMAKHKIPGLSIAVVDRDGILWTAGFGYTDYNRKTPVTPETIFSIQSISKNFTATAVMLAVQDGLVELDTPITKYLPDFTVNSRYEDDPQDKITLRHLLTHTAGFTHEAPIGNNIDARSPSFEEHVKSISDTWLRYRVGERYSYSNLGVDLAAYILQIKSGKPFAQYIKEKIFDTLNMPNSSVDMEFIRRHRNRAIGHQTHFKKTPLIPMLGAGGVYTNANELARFIQFHLNQGKANSQTVLDENLIKTIYTPTSLNKNIAMGVAVNPDNNGNDRIGSGGGGFGFLAIIGWLPEYGFGVLVLTNSVNHDNQHSKLAESVIDKLINRKIVEKRFPFDIPPCKLVNKEKGENAGYQRPHPDDFTPYQSAWKKHIGTYRYIWGGWKFRTYANIALALGYSVPELQVKVYEKSGFLEIDGDRLDEHLPGLFFTNEGECLDFRGTAKTWKNFKMKKIK
ncbi:MAG: serine hydrolase domain-containing protein [Planctomycetota bacterium]